MIRCQSELNERKEGKKVRERAASSLRPMRPLGLEELLLKDAGALQGLRSVEQCRRAAREARLTLRRDEYPRFVAWIEARYGTAFARRAGLPVGAPRLTLAS